MLPIIYLYVYTYSYRVCRYWTNAYQVYIVMENEDGIAIVINL